MTDYIITSILGLSLFINGLLVGILVDVIEFSPIVHGFLFGGVAAGLMISGMSCILISVMSDKNG